MTLPFFVYGTLRPGEGNHDLYLRGRTRSEEPGRLPDAVPEEYGRLLREPDRLEEYAPGDPRNLYEGVGRNVLRADGSTVRAWIYLAAPPVAARLRARGRLIAGGDWLARDMR
ncbi:gamma-glutamylcyclotransferase family protein [Streptomyces sp. NPDC020298]|uniref:gamma-glutamylcyclotransferase family protein n=1 Tax=unclassified Streptomyces TaxID=2593676 RepID=UPI00340B7040